MGRSVRGGRGGRDERPVETEVERRGRKVGFDARRLLYPEKIALSDDEFDEFWHDEVRAGRAGEWLPDA